MKLYATVISDRKSRPAKKGGDTGIMIHLTSGNDEKYTIVFEPHQLVIHKDAGVLFHDWVD